MASISETNFASGSGRGRGLALRSARLLCRVAPDLGAAGLSTPTFIIGSARSGTTLLTDLLRWHPGAAVFPGEANEYWHPAVYPWRKSHHDVPPYWLDPRTFTQVSLGHRRGWTGHRLRALFGWYRRLVGGRVFINKSVMINYMLEWVVEHFPDARFVHVIRDGRSATLSLARRMSRKFELAPESYARFAEMTFTEALVIQAKRWTDTILEVDKEARRLRLGQGGRLLEVRYEAFVADPQATLKRVVEYAGLDAATMRPIPQSAVIDMNVKAKTDLGPVESAAIMDVLEPALRSKGYL